MNRTPAGWLDAHCHLGRDPEGVERLIVCGTLPDDWPDVARLAAEHRNVRACYGVHPWRLAGLPPDWIDVLRRRLRDGALAVGEIGLDRSLPDSDFDRQQEVFGQQLDLAAELRLPAVVHCVRAFGALMDTLRQPRPGFSGLLLHAYAGPVEMVRELAWLGVWFSFAGNVLREDHRRARAAVAAVPADRLLVETDAPSLQPESGPVELPTIAAEVAALRGMEVEELRRLTWANAAALFGERLLA